MSWHSGSDEEIFDNLDTSKDGLKGEEAEQRLQEEGENRIESDDSTPVWKILISQFQDNLIYLLIAAAVLSIIVGEATESAIIMLILFANGLFGFVQDYKAEKSIEALKKMSTPDATVERDGEKQKVDSVEVVPGDIIHLEQGDAVPADARLLDAESLETNESALTGESNSVNKEPGNVDEETTIADRDNMVFRNTHVVRGRGKAVVVETGMDTQVGDIAEEIEEADKGETPFQKEVDELGKRIGILVIGIVTLTAILQFTLTEASLITVLVLGIGLSVAAIPESLPAIVTLTLALGSRKMLDKDALVRRLPVVEALGSVNYIVTDKTGTLTEGTMTVKELLTEGNHYHIKGTGTAINGDILDDGEKVETEKVREILECGFYCNNAEQIKGGDWSGEPTEVALKVSAMKAGIEEEKERVKSVPFTSDRKRMTVLMEDGTAHMKGAPETVLERCDRILLEGEEKQLTDERKKQILDKNEEYAKDALRVLGFARKHNAEGQDQDELEQDLVFLGLQGMIDPARGEVKEAVEDCRTAGIKVVMATGDNIETAKAIGERLGFNPEGALTGQEVEEMDEEQLQEKVREAEIFARVSPEHKVRILEALQNQDFNVAMTGDGVNDAPALKDSDVGIAMGQRGTDVAKKSSDMILQDDNFVTIRDAIEEGRHIFDNIRKVTNQLLSTNSGEVMFVFLGTLIGGLFFAEPGQAFSESDTVILTAAMILWVNFASDGPPAIALGEDPKVKGIMERQPRGRDEPIIDKKILYLIAFTGPLAATIMLPLFFLNIENFILAQTMLFMALAFFEILIFQVIRRDYGLRLSDNKYLIAGILFAATTHFTILYTPINKFFGVTPLTLQHWGYIAAALAVFFTIEYSFRALLSKKYGNRVEV